MEIMFIMTVASLAVTLILLVGENVFATSCTNVCSGTAPVITVGAGICGSNPTQAHGSASFKVKQFAVLVACMVDDMLIEIGCQNYVVTHNVVPIDGMYSADIPYNAGTYIYSGGVLNYCDGTECTSIAYLNNGCGT